jgi:alkylation response protein AidB-like acyl-CoA dehydrogenase
MLRHERITIGTMTRSRSNPLSFDSLRKVAEAVGATEDPSARRALALLYARERAVLILGRLLREEAMAGQPPGARGSVAKLASAELNNFAVTVATQVLGDRIAGYETPEVRALATAMIAAPSGAIAGGTSEIQRNIVGERVLGLAKDPGVDRDTPFNQLRVGTQKPS